MAQIQVRLVTKQEEYAIPDTPYLVPAEATGKELNSLIKAVLKSSRPEEKWDIEFDFLVADELMRLPLQGQLESKDVSPEATIEIEYFVKYPTPSPERNLNHDDWVSAVKLSENWILSGCYDDTLHLWGFDGTHKLTIPGHLAPIKSVAWIESNDCRCTFLSTSHDETAMLWQWNQEENAIECVDVCKGHTRSVDCIDVNATEHKFATGSYDQMLKIWSTNMEDTTEGDSERKRFKSSDGINKVKTPLMTLCGHTEGISGVQWMGANEICTSSMDSTLRFWDIELGGLKSQLNGSKAFFGLSYSPLSKLIVTASADRHVRLYDSRSRDGTLVKCAFTSHTGWITCVKWSPSQEYQFVSGSHDKLVKLWDTRSSKAPLYDLSGHTDKVFALDWSDQNYIATAGADNSVKLYRIQCGQLIKCEMEVQ